LQVGGQKVIMSKLGGFEDWEGYVNMNEQGWLGIVIPEFYFIYRVRPNSMYRSLSTQNRLLLEQKIVGYHPELYQLYGHELFNLSDQNEISPTYWSSPAQRHYFLHSEPLTRTILRKVANLLSIPQVIRDKIKSFMFGMYA
ncbi:MAG: hypothetical protein NZ482_10395, partial [Gloeomargarita sp. SKYG98]|nr:hypothetical protein [Gloeomargarita sp. SKYG98]